ncbi:MAG TPA: DUF3842 family protein [Tepidimicrobium sp.]|nr:DUF3842 family protein [Tepidimicrobium sp.]
MVIAVVDGQGGGIGSLIVERLRSELSDVKIQALGTNSFATNKMLRAGAHEGASGENALIYNIKYADIIVGVMAILMPNSMMGEMTPRMSEAIGSSHAFKILIPLEKCNIKIAVPGSYSIQQYVDYSVELVKKHIEDLQNR